MWLTWLFESWLLEPKNLSVSAWTNIKQNNVIKFLKHHNVPNFLINIFPIIKNKDKKIIYVPFYEDIIENKIKINLKLITLKEHKDGKDVLVFYPF